MKRSIICAVVLLFVATSAHAFETKGFSNPYGVVVDPATNYIYVSNMNGPGERKDDNGFITRLAEDGEMDVLRFIDGIQGLVELNAPKGMAIIGDFLYVADIDQLRVFDIKKGKPLFVVNFGDFPIKHFYDMTLGPDNMLYVTDGPSDTVYRIDVMREHRVTPFIAEAGLGQPHGIVWFSARQVFLVAGWKSGVVLAFDRNGKRRSFPSISVASLEGFTTDARGNAYVASTNMNAIYRIAANGGLFPYVPSIDSPIDMAYQRSTNRVLSVSYRNNALKSFPAAK
jgi:DNA-binding beta-propeller fold protein YncE